jgi:DNA (cytosine-5)-methyltransferase 3A
VKPLTVLSLFDGISCGRVALQRANIPVGKYYASEIDKYAIQVTQKNWPDTVQLGDVKEVWARNLPKIDLLIGGSPCQDLSIAKNNRKGLQGARSGLFWHYVRLLRTCKPKYFLLENVASMPKEAKEIITRELGADPILINSALVSAQQRKRLYWTNIPNITQPEDKGIILSDVLETEGVGVDVENQGRTLCKKVNKGGALMARDYKGFGNQRMTGVAEPMRVPEATQKGYVEIMPGECVDLTQMTSKTRRGRSMKDKSNCLMANDPQYYQYVKPERLGNLQGQKDNQANRIYSVRGKSVSLNANGGGGGAKTGLYKIDLPDGEYVIRKLTPLECERLQTLPDNYTAGISNTQRYKCIGNGWTVDVISHIFSFIPMEDNK